MIVRQQHVGSRFDDPLQQEVSLDEFSAVAPHEGLDRKGLSLRVGDVLRKRLFHVFHLIGLPKQRTH